MTCSRRNVSNGFVGMWGEFLDHPIEPMGEYWIGKACGLLFKLLANGFIVCRARLFRGGIWGHCDLQTTSYSAHQRCCRASSAQVCGAEVRNLNRQWSKSHKEYSRWGEKMKRGEGIVVIAGNYASPVEVNNPLWR